MCKNWTLERLNHGNSATAVRATLASQVRAVAANARQIYHVVHILIHIAETLTCGTLQCGTTFLRQFMKKRTRHVVRHETCLLLKIPKGISKPAQRDSQIGMVNATSTTQFCLQKSPTRVHTHASRLAQSRVSTKHTRTTIILLGNVHVY